MLALLSLCLLGQSPKVIRLPCPSKEPQTPQSGWKCSQGGFVHAEALNDTGVYLPTTAHLVSFRQGAHFWFLAPGFDPTEYDSCVLYIRGTADSLTVLVTYPASSEPDKLVYRGKTLARLYPDPSFRVDTARVCLKLGEEGAVPPPVRNASPGFTLHVVSYGKANIVVSNLHFFK